MDPLLEFIIIETTFGLAIAIPYAMGRISMVDMFGWSTAVHIIIMLLLFVGLDFVEYHKDHRRRIVERFCEFTNREMHEVEKNTEAILERFTAKFGHMGYYVSIAFLAFSLGFVWAAVLAYALRLKRVYAFASILVGSTLSFGFWWLVVQGSMHFVEPSAFMIFGLSMSFLFLFYGRIRERRIMLEVMEDLRLARGGIKRGIGAARGRLASAKERIRKIARR